MTRITVFVAALALSAAPALADVFDALDRVAETELDEARGGFVVEGGRVASLGAQILTTVDGREVLRTTLSAGPGGFSATESFASGLAPADSARLQAAAGRGLDVGGLSGDRVYFVQDDTAVAHRISGTALQNFIVNAADGLVLRQEVRIDVALNADAFRTDQIALSGLRIAMEHADAVRTGFR